MRTSQSSHTLALKLKKKNQETVIGMINLLDQNFFRLMLSIEDFISDVTGGRIEACGGDKLKDQTKISGLFGRPARARINSFLSDMYLSITERIFNC